VLAFVVAGAWLAALAHAQGVTRVVATGESLTVRSCADAGCRVVAEVGRGQPLDVVKVDGAWYQVLVTFDGTRATAGWVEAAKTTPSPRVAAASGGPPPGRRAVPPRPARVVSAAEEAPCLACLATRTPTANEWSSALALTAQAKPLPAPVVPGATALNAGAPAPRAEVVRRDGRSTTERMHDTLEELYGDELRRLSELASKVEPELQSYMTVCYERYMPPVVLPPGPTSPSGPPPAPARVRASLFDLWAGRPVYAWNESWSTGLLVSVDSVTFCQRLWNDVAGRAAEVKAGVDRIERDARSADIYPGVVRDVLEAYGLGPRR
jgi:hypothetical protein